MTERSQQCVRGCTLRGRHLDECDDLDCRGCFPRWRAEGLQVCVPCEALVGAWLDELPRIYDDLLVPTKISGLGERVDAEISRPALIGDRARSERDSIRACLVTWCLILMEERSLSAPEDRVAAMAARVRVHSRWLLAGEHADQLVHDLNAAVTTARRAAYPSRPDSQALGKCPVEVDDGVICGEMIRARPSDEYVSCRKCGTEAVIEWWQSAIHAESESAQFVTASEGAALLSWRYKRIVNEATIRQWAVRSLREREAGLARGVAESDLPVVTRAGRDDRGRTLYVRDDLLIYGERMLAQRAA